jgi:leader peptidase (prepilin peptidase)/N-methyltransferase
VAGLGVGGVLNTLIVRLPADEPLAERARCPECRTPLPGRDQVPVVSWVALRGRCRHCARPIPLGYPLVELANAGLWVAAGLRFGASWALPAYLFLFSVLLAQSVIDLELYRLLDRITFPALAVSAVLIPAVALAEGAPGAIVSAAIGGAGAFVVLLVPALVSPAGMGFGDVKLAGLLGLYLGLVHPVLVLSALIVACLVGVAAGGALFLARGRASRPFPFGPCLALGAVVAILASDALLTT